MYHGVTHAAPEDERTKSDRSSEPAPAPGRSEKSDKKERVLHTRVPAVLEAELKAAARSLRVPVSNLVRTILEDAVTIADRATEQVEDRLNRAAASVHGNREKMKERVQRKSHLSDVVAYQPVVMAVGGTCASCSGALEPGNDAALGITDQPGPKVFVCSDCIPGRG